MNPAAGRLRLSQDAAIVLGLARTAVPFASSWEDQAERWVRVMRLQGQVGATMQALGVGEAPLETTAAPKAVRLLRRHDPSGRVVEGVELRADELARERGGDVVSTVDVLFAVFEVYANAFERALYIRGTSRAELIEHLAGDGHTVPPPYKTSVPRSGEAERERD